MIFAFQVAVGGGEHANLRLDLGVSTDTSGFSGFEKSQQFRLELDIEFADFIEEERAAGGLFHQSLRASVGAGVSAFLAPNNSASMSSLGMAAQLRATNRNRVRSSCATRRRRVPCPRPIHPE